MRKQLFVLALVTSLGTIAPRVAHADSAEVPALIKLIENQPADLDRSTWKEKRRDAAKKLAQSKDKRGLPELTKLAENETFDVIGEIAIEGLGTLGDPAAIPTLQKIAGDSSRDKSQRDLAKKALAKLGAGEAPAGGGKAAGGDKGAKEPPPTPRPEPAPAPTGGETGLETQPRGDGGGGSGEPPATNDTGSSLLNGGTTTGSASSGADTGEAPELPTLEDDTIAAYERVTFAGGGASFQYDTLSKESQFSANVAGLYQKRVEREKLAWGVDVGASLVTGLINPDGSQQSRGAQLDITADGEVRFYSGELYGVGKTADSLLTNYTYLDPGQGQMTASSTLSYGDVEVALGGGYGRVLDVGAAIRVRRIARALDAARALGKPIDAATSKKLQLTWWSLRGERTTYRALLATIAILREAGILLSEPDAGLTYELLEVLRDTNLYARPAGFDAQIAFGEGYLRRPAGDMNGENGRYEQVIALAGYGIQLDDDKLEVSGNAYARYRLFAPMGAPSPWGAGATVRMRRFAYAEHGEPVGIIDLTGTAAISDDDQMMSDKSLGITGELGFTYLINQAGGLRLAASLSEVGGDLFFGANLAVTYGLLDGTFAR